MMMLPVKFSATDLGSPSATESKRERILVVEPDAALSEILTILFAERNYDVKVIPHADDIRPIADTFSPDLVLIEYYLPSVNGGELCTQLKEDHRFSHIPVIMYSAYPQLLWSVSDYGCDSFLGKPFDLDDLQRQVEKLLSKSKRKNGSGLFHKLFQLAPFLGKACAFL